MTEPKRATMQRIATQPTTVTFYEDRAEVTRCATIQATEGDHTVLLEGITALCDDASLQVSPKTPHVEILSATLRRELISGAAQNDAKLQHTEDALDENRAHTAQAHARRRTLQTTHETLQNTLQSWSDALAFVPEGTTEKRDSWRTAFDETLQRLQETARALEDEDHTLHELERARIKLHNRLNELRNEEPKLRAICEVQFRTPTQGPVEVRVQYRTPCALWRPEHHASLHTDPENPTQGALTLTTYGVLWHNTGERWDSVRVRLSTARPSGLSRAPLVQEDHLWKRLKTSQERRTTHVQAYEKDIQSHDQDQTVSSTTHEQLPGVDDGGEPLWLEPEGLHSIPSTGLPSRVVLLKRALQGRIDRVVYPERSMTAHRRVQARLTGSDVPLLAGPVLLKRGQSIVGRSVMEYVAVGESFTLGMGPDEVIRVQRNTTRKDEKSSMLGNQTIHIKVSVSLSNLSDQPESVQVIERVPVSELENLTIDLSKLKHWERDQDGFIHRTVHLKPHAHKELEAQYTIRASSGLVLHI